MKKSNTESKLMKAAHQDMTEPPAFVWDNIEVELHPNGKKKKYLFQWIGAGLLGFGLILLILRLGVNENIDLEHPTHNINTNIPTEAYNKNDTSKSIIENQRKEIQKSTSSQDRKKSYSNATLVEHSNINQEDLSKKNTSDHLIQNQSKNQNSSINKLISSKDEMIGDRTLLRQEIDTKKNSNQLTISKSVTEAKRSLESFMLLATLESQKLEFTRTLLPFNPYLELNNQKDRSFFIEFGTAVGLHNIGLSQNQNATYYNLRKETESSWYTIGAYGNIGKHITNQLYASIGAEWTMSKDRFEQVTDGVTKMIVTSDPASGDAIDTSFVSGSMRSKGDLTYHFIDIPINLGYAFSRNNWSYGIEISGLFNIRTISEGKIYSENEGISSIENEGNIYKKSVGLGMKYSILLAKHFNENYTIQIRPTYKTYLSDISTESYALPTSYNLFSVSVGIRKNF